MPPSTFRFTAFESTATSTLKYKMESNGQSVNIVSGATNNNIGIIQGGVNNLIITNTAEDGTSKDTTITISSRSTDIRLSEFTATYGGSTNNVSYSGQTITLATGVNEVVVAATSTYAGATVVVDGVSGTEGYSNKTISVPAGTTKEVLVYVTATDGTTTTNPYRVTFVAASALSSDTSLSTFTVNGIPVVGESPLEVAAGTTSVTVVAIPTSANADVVIIDNTTELVEGPNTFTVEVTAENGDTAVYTVTLIVAAPDEPEYDTSLSTFTVNGTPVVNGSTLNLPAGTTSVAVVATPTSADAFVDIINNTGLLVGNNTLEVEVTDNGVSFSYFVTLIVAAPAPNSDTSLSSFTYRWGGATGILLDKSAEYQTINVILSAGLVDGYRFKLSAVSSGATASVVLTPAYFATTTIVGESTTATATVTALSGASKVYTVIVNFIASHEITSLSIENNVISSSNNVDYYYTNNNELQQIEISIATANTSNVSVTSRSGFSYMVENIAGVSILYVSICYNF